MKEPPQISKSSHNVIILRQSSEHYKENSEQKLKMANDIQKKNKSIIIRRRILLQDCGREPNR